MTTPGQWAALLGLCAAIVWAPCAGAELTVHVHSEAGAPVPDAVVFVRGAAGASEAPAAAPRRVRIAQRHRLFEPFVTVVQKGTAIEFPNEDTILHHVYSFSPAKRFEFKLYRGMPPTPVVFDVPGIVAVGCNVHDWMLAYVVVLDTPYFGKTGADGVARIAGLPAGHHELMGWVPGARETVRLGQVDLASDTARSTEVQVNDAGRKRPNPPPHDPMKY